MELKVIIDDTELTLNVPQELVERATEVFDRMDRDMDRGWQMGRDWVENPNLEDRLRIVGDKLLSALEREEHEVGRLMAAYLLNRAPTLDRLTLDTGGEPARTELRFR